MNHRLAALAAGPVGLLGLVLLIVAVVVEGDDDLALVQSPVAIASTVASMIGLILIGFALVRFVGQLETLRHGAGRLGAGIAMVGTMLGVGGAWSMVFVVPGLARIEGSAADAAVEGIPLVVAGYVVSFVTLGIGWGIVGYALARSGEVPRRAAILFIVGAVLCIAPLPARFFVIGLAATYLEARVIGRSAGSVPEPYGAAPVRTASTTG